MFSFNAIEFQELEDLARHGVKTFELVCADHIAIAQKLKKGDRVFISNLSKSDLRLGSQGLLAKVMNVKIDYWRTVPREFDEKELLTTRIQVSYIDEVRVRKIDDLGPGKGIEVEIEPHVILG